MKIIILVIFIVGALFPLPLFANNLFLEGGTGVFKSEESYLMMLRFQKDTSKLMQRPSYYDFIYAVWDGDSHTEAIGAGRGVKWDYQEKHYFETTLGLAGINRRTEHLGTHFQFYIRFAYDYMLWDHPVSLGYIHFSNGKLIFQWKGPNTGENFVTLSVGLF